MPAKWHNAEKEHPEENKVVLFQHEGSDKNLLALWRDGKYYIFEFGNCEWAEYGYYFRENAFTETPPPLSDFKWKDAGAEAYKHVPFYALAEARRNRIG